MKVLEDQWPDSKACTGCKVSKDLGEFRNEKKGRFGKASKT